MILPPLRAYLIPFAVGVALVVGAKASDLPPGVTCPDVRAAVETVAKQTGKTLTEAAVIVEAMARAGGATDGQVAEAKRCLPSSSR